MIDNPRLPLAPNLRALLDGVRRRIRRYVWLEGISGALAWLGVVFWASLAIDWFFEPPPWVRGVVLAVSLAAVAWVVYALLLRRAFVPLRDASMAVLLERRYPQFRDSLLTAVELAGARDDAECDPVLLASTCRQAADSAALVRLREVFNARPLRRRVIAATLLVASVVAFGLLRPDLLGIWAERTFAQSDRLWPRFTALELEGFQDGVAKVAKGTDLDIVAKADLGMPLVPDLLEVQYREGGGRTHKPMNREGNADPEKDQFQRFTYTFRSILAPIVFDVVGGDAALRGYRIEVVDNPTIVAMTLDCEYPAYMGREPRSFPFTNLMQFPAGSRITIRATTNKDLVRVAVDSPLEASAQGPKAVLPDDPSSPRSFHHTIDALTKDATLLLTLYDTDGIKSRDPVRITLAAMEDRRPEFAAQLQGIGPAITPQAQLPATGRVSDDYGLAKIWFEYEIDKQVPASLTVAEPKGDATEFPLTRNVLDARTLNLKPGQKLQVCLKASDRCTLGSGPNVGTSDRWQLDVVTPDQLRTLLQGRELVLRQRFEAVMKDVIDARETLARIDFNPPRPKSAKSATSGKGAEPGEKVDEDAQSPERIAAQRRVSVQWASQNSVKDAHECQGVADAISDIREELINNRIDTEELKNRLENGIADPLRRIAQEMFPELDRRIDRLQSNLGDATAGTEARNRAVQQVDAILLAMRQVLSRMIELEDFNEAVELLRSIIQSQEKVNAETKQQQKQKLRDLLE